MRALTAAVIVGALVAVAFAGPPNGFDIDDARMAKKIEMQLDKAGRMVEIEFHVDPKDVPAAVRAAMDKLHPGGPFTGAEKEREDGVLYYELTREVNGFEVEAMFSPDGRLHSEEIQVPENEVPGVVKAAVAAAYPKGSEPTFEEIRNDERNLVEYHVKLSAGGRKHKVMVSPGGTIKGAVLELEAEIEVPAPPTR